MGKEEEEKSEKGDAPKEDQEKDKKSGGVSQMKRGDYMIHVYIEQAKNIEMEENSTVDPIVAVTVLGNN